MLFAVSWLALATSLHAAGEITRSFVLQPGWNAIHLDVQPPNPAPEQVFAGVPLEMAWCFFPTESSVQFITDPGERLFNVPGWTVYLPPTREDAAALTNLYAIQAGRSYLVKVGAAVTLTITGRAVSRAPRWAADGYTLTGLAVDPASSVALRDYFLGSPAHTNQPAYRLDPAGAWTRVSGSATIRAGEAYWIYTRGPADFLAPLLADLAGGGEVAFGALASRIQFQVRNATPFPISAQIENVSPLPLLTSNVDAAGNQTWAALTTLAVAVPAGGATLVDLGLQRDGFNAAADGLLKITGGGYALNVPVSAETPSTTAAAPAPRAALAPPAPPATTDAGLWVGSVTLNKVNHHLAANPNTPSATPAEFTFRMIVHVDANGAARLLKEVWLLRKQSGTEFALVTDPSRLSQYRGATIREDEPFGYRFSSVAFDFAGLDVPLTGAFGTSLAGGLTVGRDLPTNPFKHKFHPQHDDKDGKFDPLPDIIYTNSANVDKQEVFEIERALSLTFDAPSATAVPGNAPRTGSYTETFRGLHKRPLNVEGTFTLRRVNELATLNPAP